MPGRTVTGFGSAIAAVHPFSRAVSVDWLQHEPPVLLLPSRGGCCPAWARRSRRDRNQHVRIPGQYPFALVSFEHRQGMTCARDRPPPTCRRGDDRELRPHERPVADDRDFLDLAGSVEMRRTVGGLRARCCGELRLAHGRLPGYE